MFSFEGVNPERSLLAVFFCCLNNFRLYVNGWGRDIKEIIASRVGVKALARFLCTGEKDSVSEIAEITHPKADPFQDFGLVVAAFNKTV